MSDDRPSKDLVTRLRTVSANSFICWEAADEIERLQAGVKFLENVNAELGAKLRASAEPADVLKATQRMLGAAQVRVQHYEKALRQFAECDLNESNCASLDVATRRIRSVAREALNADTPAEPPADDRDATIKSLCDRLERINQHVYAESLTPQERLMLIERISGGFMDPTASETKSGMRTCGICGVADIPRGVDWPSWTDGEPVHTSCQTRAIREHRAATETGGLAEQIEMSKRTIERWPDDVKRAMGVAGETSAPQLKRVWTDHGSLGNGRCSYALAWNGAACCLPAGHAGEHRRDSER